MRAVWVVFVARLNGGAVRVLRMRPKTAKGEGFVLAKTRGRNVCFGMYASGFCGLSVYMSHVNHGAKTGGLRGKAVGLA